MDEETDLPSVRHGIVNSYSLLSSCGRKKISYTEVHLALVRNTEAHAGQRPHVQKPLARSENVVSKVTRLDSRSNKHWPVPSNQMWCCVCSACRVTNKVSVKCHICEVGLHADRTVSYIITPRDSCQLLQVQPPAVLQVKETQNL
jgi:hypothetical protein